MNNKNYGITDTDFLVKSAFVAALYVVLTLIVPMPQYGPIQFRFSEIMVLLVFYNKRFIPGLILGCIISNLFSPMARFDVIFGTLASYMAFSFMCKAKNIYIASIYPVIFMVIPAFGTYILLDNTGTFLAMLFSFMISEFIMVSIIGVILFKVLEKNNGFMKYVINF